MTFCSRAVSTAHRTIEQFVPSPTRLPGLRSNHPTARAGRQTIGAPLTDPDGGLYSHAERQCKCRTMLVAQAALDGLRAPHSHARGGISWRGCRRDSRLRASRGSGGFAATNLRQRMSLRGRPAPASRRLQSGMRPCAAAQRSNGGFMSISHHRRARIGHRGSATTGR